MEHKLDYRKVFLLGFGLFGAQLMWMIYNTYMPIFLQAGSPAFAARAGASTMGFGLSATVTGFLMSLDNIAAFFIQPTMGPISDRTRTRFGRRMPFILVCAPIAVIAFALIPLAPQMIPAELNGDFSRLGGLFALLIGSASVMLAAMAVWRTPLFALMPDLVPSRLRSQANGIINLMAGIGGILAFVVGGILYNIYRPLPFWFGGALTLVAVAVLFRFVKEPAGATEAAEVEGGLGIFKELRAVPRENKRSLVLLILTIFFYMVGYNAVETFFSSYAVSSLGLKESSASFVLAASYVSFILFAIPSGFLAARVGRRRVMLAGLALFGLALIAAYFTRSVGFVVLLMATGGVGWAFVNINGLPMVLDTSTSEDLMGTYSGLYFIAATSAATFGPILNGKIIDLSGGDYSVIFLVCPLFFLLSFLCLLGVRKGEAKSGREGEAARAAPARGAPAASADPA